MIRQGKHRNAQIKCVSSLFIRPNVHDAVREGHQMMSNMEDYNDASAMAAPGTHQLSAGLEIIALHKKTVQASICTGTIQCVHVRACACVRIENIRPDEKHTNNFFQVHKCKRVLSRFSLEILIHSFFLFVHS